MCPKVVWPKLLCLARHWQSHQMAPTIQICSSRGCGLPCSTDPRDGYVHRHCCSMCKKENNRHNDKCTKHHSSGVYARSPCVGGETHSPCVGRETHMDPPSPESCATLGCPRPRCVGPWVSISDTVVPSAKEVKDMRGIAFRAPAKYPKGTYGGWICNHN